jgi:hypothetical protein
MTTAAAESRPMPWKQGNLWVVGLLAFLVPGLGHLYQGRILKAVIYSVCILGTFFGGMQMGEWVTVYHLPQDGKSGSISLSYAGQLLVGACAMPAWFQTQRYLDPQNSDILAGTLTDPIRFPIRGELIATGPGSDGVGGTLVGELEVAPNRVGFASEITGKFTGTVNGKPAEIKLAGSDFLLARPIGGGFDREVRCSVARSSDQHQHLVQVIQGSTPRSWINAFEAPPDPRKLNDLNGRLGKYYELALVFTWIAGLLNVLAFWDALLGPAYGFGDELDSAKQTGSNSPAVSGPPPEIAGSQPVLATPSTTTA